jgi:hypothetical protein
MECWQTPTGKYHTVRKLGPRKFVFYVAEKQAQRGRYISKRLAIRKIFSNLKFICNYIESKASKAGVDTSDGSPNNVHKMFKAAKEELIVPDE